MFFDYSRSVISILGLLGITATGILLCISLVWVLIKTGSLHVLFARLWRLANGKATKKASVVSGFFEERTELMWFRFITAVRARTLLQAESLIAWTKENDEDIGDVKGCGKYFNIESLGLVDEKKLPKRGRQCALFGISALLIFSILLTAFFALQNKAILQMKQSGVWFFLTQDAIVTLFSQEVLSVNDCKNNYDKIVELTKFNNGEVGAACEMLQSQGVKNYIVKSVSQQRTFFIFVGVIFFTWFIQTIRSLLQGEKAIAMLKRLKIKSNIIEEGQEQKTLVCSECKKTNGMDVSNLGEF